MSACPISSISRPLNVKEELVIRTRKILISESHSPSKIKKMKKIRYKLTLLLMLGTLCSCGDWLNVEMKTELTGEKLVATNEGIQQMLNGAYLIMRNGLYTPEGQMGGGGTLESLAGSWNVNPGTAEYYLENQILDETMLEMRNDKIFKGLYNIIANLNPLINGMAEHEDKLKPEIYNVVMGEALAMRAFVHLDLIRLYGPTPVKIDPTEAYLPYVKVNHHSNYKYLTFADYMKDLLGDLDKAEELLGEYDPIMTMSFSKAESGTVQFGYRRSRFNYYAVLGIQARARLWAGDEDGALEYARKVKTAENDDQTPKLELIGSLSSNTEDDNTAYIEHILGTKCDTYDYKRGSVWAVNRVAYVNSQDNLWELLYDDNDDDIRRVNLWLKQTANAMYGTSTGFYITKYHSFITGTAKPRNCPLLRLSEIYFIIMELGTLAEANTLYEEFCTSRAKDYVPLTESDRSERVMRESISELIGEGQNFFTYKRFGATRKLFVEGEFTEESYRMPLPESELKSE